MNTPARFRLCELRRAGRVAEELGWVIEIVDGKIRLVPSDGDVDIGEKVKNGLEADEDWYL